MNELLRARHYPGSNQVRDLNYTWTQCLIFVSSSSGESPPPPPRAFFGRDELIEEIVDLAGNLTPLALIGTGGIGKTSIALTVLHDSRIKQRFGNDRRFIRCDQFSASLTHFLSRLSKVIGAGVQNPEDLTPLRPFLSSKEMIIVLDNAESILDPQLPDAEEIHSVVEELSQLSNICLCITSRISTIPPDCETLDIPTLSMEAARDTFYRIHRNAKRSDLINDILERLDFHPLSITLLSTAAHHNKWDTNRLSKEWEKRRTGVLQTHHHKSLAATIELSLTSPMFQELGADGRELLGVIAFFPQGIDEDNLEWLFPAISDPTNVFDNFCILSLTYRSNGFVTMLAPLRDHLCPKDPNSSPLLCATKDLYVRRLSDYADPDWPSFEETRWIASEDVNVEHLLNVFTSIDKNSDGIWSACTHFMDLLYWHKPRLVVLGPRIEALPDSHPSKPQCLLALSSLFGAVRNLVESKRLLAHALGLWRGQGNDLQVARTLKHQAYANLWLHLHAEGIPQAKEASEIYERLNRTVGQTSSLRCLAFLLAEDGQADAAEEALSRATDLSSGKPSESDLCEHNHILGHISLARGEMDAAITHHQKAHGIAASLDSRESLSLITRCLVHLLLKEGRFDDAAAHLEFLESDVDNDIVSLGLAALVQACVWRRQGRVEEAEAELSRVIGLYRKMGVSSDFMERCNAFRRQIEEKMNSQVNSTGSGGGGELLGTMILPVSIDPLRTES